MSAARHISIGRWWSFGAALLVAVCVLALAPGPAAPAPPPGSAHDKLGKIVGELVDGKIGLRECGRRVDPLVDELNETVPGADWDDGLHACVSVVGGWLREGRITVAECEQALSEATHQDVCDTRPEHEKRFEDRPEVLAPFKFDAKWAEWLTDTSPDAALPHELAAKAGGFGGEGSKLQGEIQAVALALLSVILTFSVLHYWASGFVNTGGMEVATASLRVGGAGLLILAWPDVVSGIGTVEAAASSWIMGGPDGANASGALEVLNNLGPSSGDAFNDFLPDGLDLISKLLLLDALFAFLFGLAIALTMLALSVAKLMLTFGLAVLYLGMPLGLALWPMPGFNWLPGPALRAAGAMSFVPVGWSASLVSFSQIGGNIWPQARGDEAPPGAFLPAFADPMLGIMLLLFLFAVMRQILRWGGVIPQGSRPFGAAWGAVMGLGYMGFRAATSGVRMASSAGRRRAQGQRWAQQEARGFAKDLGQSTERTERSVNDAARRSQDALNRANAMERDGARRTMARGDEAARRQREAIDRGRIQDPARAEGAAYGQKRQMTDRAHGDALQHTKWQSPSGANLNPDTRMPESFKDRVDAEWRGSDYRFDERGGSGPTDAQTRDAWYALSTDQRRSLQEHTYGVPHGADGHPAPEHAIAQAAATDGITPEQRTAYRTLLDASQHNGGAFLEVTADPPERVRR